MKRIGCLLALALAAPAIAQVESPVQTSVKVNGYKPFSPVYLAGSDAASKEFQVDALPGLLKLADTRLSERGVLADSSALAVDPARLKLREAADVRVYFVAEGAGYRNTLGARITEGAATTAGIVFPDASSSVSYLGSTTPKRTSSTPLLAGDFVDLGRHLQGSILDFFLVSDGASGGRDTFGTNASTNPDRTQHVVAFTLADSPFLLLGFEDMWGGGDHDYNDLVVAVDIGYKNVAVLRGPEPTLPALLAAIAGITGWRRRGAGWRA